MSLVPVLVQLARELENEHRLAGGLGEWDRFLDDDFGLGINPVDIFRPRLMAPMHQRRSALAPYLLGRRRHHHNHQRGDGNELSATGGVGNGTLMPSVGKDGFQVSIDVSQFKPNELTVKTVDNTVVIEGKHEEREDDHGLIQRHFVRKFTLPKNYNAIDVKSTISSDGVLTVKAPPPAIKDAQNERIVQIQQTGVSSKPTPSIKQTQNGDSAAAGDAGNVEAAK